MGTPVHLRRQATGTLGGVRVPPYSSGRQRPRQLTVQPGVQHGAARRSSLSCNLNGSACRLEQAAHGHRPSSRSTRGCKPAHNARCADVLSQNDTRRHKTPPHLEATNQGPEASRPTSTPLLLRRLAEGTCMGVRAPPYSSELSQRPARRRIGQGVVQSDPNITRFDKNSPA